MTSHFLVGLILGGHPRPCVTRSSSRTRRSSRDGVADEPRVAARSTIVASSDGLSIQTTPFTRPSCGKSSQYCVSGVQDSCLKHGAQISGLPFEIGGWPVRSVCGNEFAENHPSCPLCTDRW